MDENVKFDELVASDTETATQTATEQPEQTAPVEKKEEVVPYTDEELAQINFDEIDESRLPEQGRLFYEKFKEKSQQPEKKFKYDPSHYQFQTPQQKQEFRTVEDRVKHDYLREPQSVLNNIRTAIYQKRAEANKLRFDDPDKAAQFDNEALYLEQKRDELIDWGNNQRQNQDQRNNVMRRAKEAVESAVPNFDRELPKLVETAINDMGFTEEQVWILMSPDFYYDALASKGIENADRISVELVKNFVGHIKKYGGLTGKTLKEKMSKEPPKTVQVGRGNQATEATSNAKLKSLFDRAKKSGSPDDYAIYFNYKDELESKKE